VTRRTASRRPLTPRGREARKFAAIGQLASGLAHEINTPTQYIGDNLRFLLTAFEQLVALIPAEVTSRGEASSEIAFLLEEIPSAVTQSLEGVGQVGHLVDAVKRFATAHVVDVGLVDLNEEVESVLTVARNEWKYVATVERDLDPALPRVPGAAGELKQVILHLVTGAARAIAAADRPAGTASMHAVGRITVRTRHDGQWVELAIGHGNPGDDPAAPLAPALAFARDVIVGEHGGTVHLESPAGTGTTVVLRLPRDRDVPAVLA
jgi:signal transduction histidine kinase